MSEISDLIHFLIHATKDVESPMNIKQLSRDFKDESGASETVNCLNQRIRKVRADIHKLQQVDTRSKVKLMFGLSAPVNVHYLKKLRKAATVEVDQKKRITRYTANDGGLHLKGYHFIKTEHSSRKVIVDFFKGNRCDGDNDNHYKMEMVDMIKFVTKKCEHVELPLHIDRMAEDFKICFKSETRFRTVRSRICVYRDVIQQIGSLDHVVKVEQLFGLSAALNADCLKQLRKDALVEVDNKNRITKYVSNDGKLNLQGNHSSIAKKNAWLVTQKKSRKVVTGTDDSDDKEGDESDGEREEEAEEIDSDEESLDDKESDGSDEEELDEDPDDSISSRQVNPANNTFDMGFDPPMQNPMQNEKGLDEEAIESEAGDTTEETSTIKTRSGRLSRRRHFDSDLSNYSRSIQSLSSAQAEQQRGLEHPKSAKKKKTVEGSKVMERGSPRSSRRSNKSQAPSDERGDLDEPMDKGTFKTPTSTRKKRKNDEKGPSSSKRSARPPDPTDDSDIRDYSFDDFHGDMIYTPRVKLEKFSASIVDKKITLDDDEEDIQTIALPGIDLVAPKLEEEQVIEEPMLLEPKQEPGVNQPLPLHLPVQKVPAQSQGNSSNLPRSTAAPVQNQGNQNVAPAKPIPMKDLKKELVKQAQPKEEFTTKRNALKTIHSLVLTLDLPSLTDLQKKIESKIKKVTDEPYLISGFLVALENCYFLVSNNMAMPSIAQETTCLSHFLLLLKGSVITSKLKGFNGFQKKLNEKIEELSVEDRKIPIDQVKCAIEATLNIVSLNN